MHADVHAGKIGSVVLARARYGWAGPWWGQWFYRPGGGALFDLAIYNLMSLCGFMGPVRRVCAMVGTAIPRRMAEGVEIAVQADDNAQVLLDFGDSRFACITTGFTMQKYRSPAVELYGTDGVLQLLGDDWAPQGFERWTKEREVWELHEESEPLWPWTVGLAAPRRMRRRRNAARQPARARLALPGGHPGGASLGPGRAIRVDRNRISGARLPAIAGGRRGQPPAPARSENGVGGPHADGIDHDRRR